MALVFVRRLPAPSLHPNFMRVWICDSAKEGNLKKDRQGFFNPVTQNSNLL